MKSQFKFALVLVSLIFGGCAVAPQQSVQLDKGALVDPAATVGVVMTTIPKVDMSLPGASCLLCYAAAAVANNGLMSYTKTLPTDDAVAIKQQMVDALRAKGLKVTVIKEDIDTDKLPSHSGNGQNATKKDFSSFKTQYKVDRLVVIDIRTLGMVRNYSAYVPTSDPKAVLDGAGYMINLSTNTYDWYQPISIMKSADGAWDEPPAYPGLTNAYFQAIEDGRSNLLKPFSN